jgi:MoxR-like ATPase
VAPALKAYLIEIAQATRRTPNLALGMSPRATLALQRVAKARAAAQNRGYVTPDDVKALAVPVLAHRLLVTPEAQLQGLTPADVLADVLRAVPTPGGH